MNRTSIVQWTQTHSTKKVDFFKLIISHAIWSIYSFTNEIAFFVGNHHGTNLELIRNISISNYLTEKATEIHCNVKRRSKAYAIFSCCLVRSMYFGCFSNWTKSNLTQFEYLISVAISPLIPLKPPRVPTITQQQTPNSQTTLKPTKTQRALCGKLQSQNNSHQIVYCCCVRSYVLAIDGQTAEPNELKFVDGTLENPGGNIG